MSGDATTVGVPATFKSFCIEGLQKVAPGRNTFATTTAAIAAAPLGSGSPIGGERAALLTSFWRQYGPATAAGFTDKTDAAAFQLAVWEITNDARTAGSKITADLTAGQFSVNAAGRSQPAVLRAQQWLAAFDTTAPARNSVVLYALQSPTAQDQVTCVSGPVDLDVDSDNTGTLDRSAHEDDIEYRTDLPGVIVPVGLERVPMIVDVPEGRTAVLAFDAGAARKVRVYSPSGAVALEQSRLSTPIIGGSAKTFWIEAFAPSASMADIALTLTATDGGAASSDTIQATAMAVNLDVIPSVVDEDGSQGLIYTFTGSVALPTPLAIAYDVGGGTATEGLDYTGLPPGGGVRSITIPANATTASVTVFPTPDSEIEDDETVMLTLLPGAGYGLGTRTVATGTILNDDYFFDLILDGLPEESASPPNELAPGAILPIGGGRKRLDIVVESPGDAGTITLTVPTGADKITLWDAATGGQQVQPGAWQIGEHPNPRTLWVKDTGIEGEIQLVAMFQNRGQTKEDAVNAIVTARPDIEIDATKLTASVWGLPINPPDLLSLKFFDAIVVDQAMGTFRSIEVKAQAIDDPAIGRDHAEDFYFQGKQTTSAWSIFRGADHNPGTVWNWLRDYHPGEGVSTPADFENLPDDKEKYWESEFKKWSDPRITAQRMTGTLDVTYVYAGKLDPATTWIRRRNDFDLAAGDPTPADSEYPYPRPLNVDSTKWVQEKPHHAVQPAGWDLTSTLTLHFEFTIDLENDVRTVVGAWAIDDIDGQSDGRINVDVSIAAP